MQFTVLGTTVIIIRNREVLEAPMDPEFHKASTPEELLEITRRKALELQALGDTRVFF